MYYCKNCGHRSQGDACANPNCKDFIRKLFVSPPPQDPNFVSPSPQNPNHPSSSMQNANPYQPRQDEELSINFREEFDAQDSMQRPQPDRSMPQWDLDFGNGGMSDRTPNFMGRTPNFTDNNPNYNANHPTKNNPNPNCNMPNVPCNNELQISFATTPFQRFESIYPEDKGLTAGTIFAELDMPYAKRKVFGGYNG